MSLKSVLYVGLAASVLALWAPGCGDDDDDDSAGAGGSGTGGEEATGGDSGDTGGAANGGDTGDSTGGGSGETEESLYDFATDDGDVTIADYDGSESDGIYYVNVGSPNDRETQMGLDPATSAPEAVWADVEGFDGESGVLQMTAPYNGYNQAVDMEWNFDTPQDMSGKILVVRVKVANDGGFVTGENAAGGGTIFAKSVDDNGVWIYARGGWYNLLQDDYGSWIEFEFKLDDPDYVVDGGGFDPAFVRAVGVQISTGGAIGDTDPTSATVYIDQIGLITP